VDPYVFGPPGSGSVIICTDPDLDQDTSINKQKSKKNLDFYHFFRLLIDFLSLKTDVTVPSKSNKRIT